MARKKTTRKVSTKSTEKKWSDMSWPEKAEEKKRRTEVYREKYSDLIGHICAITKGDREGDTVEVIDVICNRWGSASAVLPDENGRPRWTNPNHLEAEKKIPAAKFNRYTSEIEARENETIILPASCTKQTESKVRLDNSSLFYGPIWLYKKQVTRLGVTVETTDAVYDLYEVAAYPLEKAVNSVSAINDLRERQPEYQKLIK